VHPALAATDQVVTVHLDKGMDKPRLRAFMASFQASVAITAQEKGGYVFLGQATNPDENGHEVFVYRPKYRTVSYITDLTGALFKFGRFTSQRAVSIKGEQQGQVPAAPGASLAGPGQAPRVEDSGSNAYSVQDRPEADALIFVGSASEVATLRKLLPQIDTPAGEVLVHGVLYEVTTTSAEGSGLALMGSILGKHFGVQIGEVRPGDAVSVKVGDFSAVVSLLATDGRFKSINNASVRVKSGLTGVLSVGSNVPVLGSVTVAGNGTTQQSISYQPSGVIFNLSPVIRDGSIDLTILEQISTFVKTTTGVNGSPTLIKREMSTTVASGFEDVIVLGGLDQDSANSSSSGAGFLPNWMHSHGGDSTKTEVILLLNVRKI
jgi:type II secretory pathway component GspD/PulD (secretin)